ncbi:copper amine oxidase [Thermoanaerobacter sp. YS13]|uniref:stalk domain-containing protein n=1 Tax=Thermoanaerobacter sp. YS13 TaxID=1511746 RepID=UPI0005738613|nr:stalk domain-containing protein [Thermoanaerobacter sp. YS13]KHO61731.1 copper amine oxidase [Thermoanaerobacter sp. YS13]
MRRKGKYLFIFLLIFLIYSGTFAYATETYNIDGKNIFYNYPPINILIDGVKQNPNMRPLMIDNHVFVPVRFVSEKMGAQIGYDSTKVWITYNGDKIVLYFYKDTAYVNDKPVKLDSSVKLVNYGYTYVPLRFIGEAFKNNVKWDENTRTVYIEKEKETGAQISITRLSNPNSSVSVTSQSNLTTSATNQGTQALSSNPYTIDGIGFTDIDSVRNVTILTQDTNYNIYTSPTKDAIFVDLNNAILSYGVRGFARDDKIVRGIIPIQLTPTSVRIIITLNSDANYSVSQQDGKLLINLQPISMNLPSSLMVNADVVNIRTGPGTQYDIITQVNNGDILSVIDKSGDWYKVKLQDGTIGWIAGWLTTVYNNSNQVTNNNSNNFSDRRVLTASNIQPSRGSIGQALTSLPYAGKGVWYSIYSAMPTANDLSRFVTARVTHIYLEVATSKAGFLDEWKKRLDDLLPAAHRAGIKVIAWLYTDLKDTSYDASLTAQVANYVTPNGYRVDGVAADIEELPQKDPATASKMVEDYATQTLKNLPAGMPFIAITYPPQYRPNYPYATMAKYFDAIALMDYWHVSSANYTYDDAKNFVSDSIKKVQFLAGNNVNIEVILHGYDDGYGLPSVDELRGALDASKDAVGYSIYTWNTLNDELKDVFANY